MDIDGNNKKCYYVGTNEVNYRRDNMDIKNSMSNGLIEDWEATEEIIKYIYKNRLMVDSKEYPLLCGEPSFNTTTHREKFTELAFEKFEVPAFFISKNGVLSSFASGKSNALVVDCGGGVTCITPVHDGYALQKCIIKSSLAGNLLTEEYKKVLTEQKGIVIRPRYLIDSKKEIRHGEYEVRLKDFPLTTNSYKQFMLNQIIRDLKESVCRVSDTYFNDDYVKANVTIPTVSYELPDGSTIELGADRFKIPELLFNPDSLNVCVVKWFI